MREIEVPFKIEYHGSSATVVEAEIKDRRVFHIQFSDGTLPLILTIAYDTKEVKYWASVPQGRPEAEEVGKLIAAYIRGKSKNS